MAQVQVFVTPIQAGLMIRALAEFRDAELEDGKATSADHAQNIINKVRSGIRSHKKKEAKAARYALRADRAVAKQADDGDVFDILIEM